ncbi:MAG: response regulator [Proteobacteria bacterium]|nr:response regulator [Pseudomonadota bacterium]
MELDPMESNVPGWPTTSFMYQQSGQQITDQGQWVLVVDDDPANRSLERIVLQVDNFAVREAANGFEALELIRGAGKQCILVLTDYEMPGMQGDELAARIRQIDPALPIMLITGREAITQEHIRAWGIKALLHKPYEIDTFLQTVRSLIDGGKG